MTDPIPTPTECAFQVELVIQEGPRAGERHLLDSFPIYLGRGDDADIALAADGEDPKLSRRHLKVSVEGGHVALLDNSTNGTRVDGRLIKPGEPFLLSGGEMVAVGARSVISLRLLGGDIAPQSAPAAPSLRPGEGVPLTVEVLGPVRVQAGALELDPRTAPKAMVLLACLADGPAGRMMTADTLIDLLWSDTLNDAKAALQATVSRLRRTFRTASAALPDPVVLDGGGYRLSPSYQVRCDSRELETLCEEAGRTAAEGRLAEAAVLLEKAVALYRGPFLPGQSNDWVEGRRRTLENRFLEALDTLGEVRDRQGNPSEAVRVFEKVLAAEPCRERSQVGLMKALSASGRRDEALRSYYDFVARLKKEMGLGPGPELLIAYEKLRA